MVGEIFAREFTVYAMDRRGRGGSGDAPEYSLEREAEDVAAVLASIEAPANVLGHSYGGLCAIEASLLTSQMRRLVLYESVPLDGRGLYPDGIVDRLQGFLAAGDMDALLVALYRDVVEMSAEELELTRSQRDAWATRVRNGSSVPRELRTEQRYRFSADRFSRMTTPTLLIVGGDSPARELTNANGVARALPDARVAILEGQQHIAMYTAPDAFAAEVIRFCRE